MDNNIKVLFVDDEEQILNSIKRTFRKESYEIITCSNPEEALKLVVKESFAVVVSDQKMPVMEGTKLLEKVREVSPDTTRIILTGHSDIAIAIEAINIGAVYRFLSKPWSDNELRIVIKQAISYYNLISENKYLQELTKRQNEVLKGLNQNLEQKVQERTQEILVLNSNLKKSFYHTIKLLADLSEMHNKFIGSHSRRVARLSKEISLKMSISGDDLFHIEIAALLHDIGTIGMPISILEKSNKELLSHEMPIYKKHVIKGELIVKQNPYLKNAAKLIRHHHEHMNGSGYPDSLVGDKIPIGSQIIAVADAYDNILNNKNHYRSKTPEVALSLIKTKTPDWFSPEVVSTLKSYLIESKRFSKDGLILELRIKDLKVGMVLAKDLNTVNGTLLLGKDIEITQSQIKLIHQYHDKGDIIGDISVYRNKMEK